MSRITQKFSDLESKNEKALVAYMMAGFPSEKGADAIITGLIHGGADIIEIGFPFSDPLADGPVIQNASTVSLEGGTNTNRLLETIRKTRKKTEIPLVLMTYANVVYHKGYAKFVAKAVDAGIDGFIIPDMSIEESKEYLSAVAKKADTIFLASPNTSKKRLGDIAYRTTGFLYLVAVYGTTGTKSGVQNYTIDAIKKTKKIVGNKVPVCVGFGVSNPADVKKFVTAGADGVIVGSALLRLAESVPQGNIKEEIAKFTKKLKRQTKA